MSDPRILFFDIESAGVNALKSDLGFVLMFGYKWAHEKRAHALMVTQEELKSFNDGPLLTRLSTLYVEADMTVAHFGSVFDRRFIQGRLLIHHLPPIPFTKMRDTCMIARSVANFSSNRLKHLAKILNLKHQKLDNEWPTWWFEAMQGNMAVVRKMATYCKGDVLALEELYYALRPFDNAHPRLYTGATCGHCGSSQLNYRGVAYVGALRYRRYHCLACGKWARERKCIPA